MTAEQRETLRLRGARLAKLIELGAPDKIVWAEVYEFISAATGVQVSFAQSLIDG